MSTMKKSLGDHKLYRVIKLDNGLVALLVEDKRLENSKKKKRSLKSMLSSSESKDDKPVGRRRASDKGIASSDSVDSDMSEGDLMEEEEEDCEREESSVGSRDESMDDEEEGSASEKNKIKTVDPDDMSSGCALCVNIGSFSDPDDIPGLAHLLEHMVFMGSDKYPGDNAFDLLTNRHGGYDNASTDYEQTIFTFSINNRHLKEALDMFAHFFVSPQLLEESLNREIEAVDSEFQTSIQKDADRLQQLLCTLAKPGHPYSKFVWGNAKSLKENIKDKGIDLCKRLREFYRQMYSSHYMTLAVQSADSLDDLEEWVKESFTAIPRNDLPCPEFSSDFPPYDEVTFNKLIKVIPVKDTQEIHMHWLLPPLHKYYRTKPLQYLGWLLGHEGKGSVMAYLKKRYMATSLSAGNGGLGYEFSSCFSLFSCSITLTLGSLHYLIVASEIMAMSIMISHRVA